jgi:ABC-type dipeptide/oligopeptide/nickel transport system permease subunit
MTAAQPIIETPAGELLTTAPTSIRRDTLRNILRQRAAVVGLAIMAFLVAVAIFAPVIAPYDPNVSMLDLGQPGVRGAPPCIHLLGCPEDQPQHLMGLDSNIRDEFSRVVFGARVSLQIGIVTVSLAIIVGALIGAVAGFAGGRTDDVLMRFMDIVLSFPSLILAILIVTVVGSGLYEAMLAIAIVSIPVYARVMRASVFSVRESDFVTASRALGESSRGILSRRVLPNAMTPLIVQGTLGIGVEAASEARAGRAAAPRGQGPSHDLPHPRRRRAGGRRHRLPGRSWGDHGSRRRVRMRQERHQPVDPEAGRQARRDRGRRGHLRRPGPVEAAGRHDAHVPR